MLRSQLSRVFRPCLRRATGDTLRRLLPCAAARCLSSSSSPPAEPGSKLKLFNSSGKPNASRKQKIVATTVREALAVTLSSGIIKDRGFGDGAAVTILDVQVSKNCQEARVLWEPMHSKYDAAAVQRALKRRSGILKQHVNSYVNQKWAIHLEYVPAPTEETAPHHAAARAEALFEAMRVDLDKLAARRRADEDEEAADTEDDHDAEDVVDGARERR